MPMPPVKVNAKYQITLPSAVVKELRIQKGDSLLMDMQDGVIIMIPKPRRYTDHLQGLQRDIWKDIDVQKYLDRERNSWTNPANV